MKNKKLIIIKCFQISCIYLISFGVNSCKKVPGAQPAPTIQDLSIDSLKVLASNIPTAIYTDLTFINSTTGFAISQGQVIKTSDGGYNWTSFTTPVSVPMIKIQFINEQTGYIIGSDNNRGVLLKTINSGGNWDLVYSSFPDGITGMYFLNSQVGFITGKDLFSKTSDGGISWTSVKSGFSRIYNDVNFKNSNEGVATGSDGVYFTTSNGGASWDSIHTSAGALFNIYFAGPKVLAVKSSDALIDLANNYAVSIFPSNIHKLLFLNADKCIGIGSHYETGFWPYGDILTTNNGWATFKQKRYTPVEAMSFGAITKMQDGSIMMLGTGFSGTKVIVLKR